MSVIGDKFPEIKAKTLSGEEIVLPEYSLGKTSLVGVAFVRGAQGMLDSWIKPFEKRCDSDRVYEVPMIAGFFWRIFSGFIDEGMKSGIPAEKHDNVATFYGDTEKFKEKLSIEDDGLGYVFLLDKEGIIRFKGEGYADDRGIGEMLKLAKGICELDDES